MSTANIAILLVYEPESTKGRPVPLARVSNPDLAADVAKSAIEIAQARADEISAADELLGEVEQAEVIRLRRVLSLIVPGLAKRTGQTRPVTTVVH